MTAGGPARPRRVPERQCVACRTMAPRDGMLRLVRRPDGQVVLDEGGHTGGRGAYVCKAPGCVGQAIKRGAFNRALRRPIPADLSERIIALVANPGTSEKPTEQGNQGTGKVTD